MVAPSVGSGVVAHKRTNFLFAEAGQFNTGLPCGRVSDCGFEFPPAVGVDADGFLSTADAHIELLTGAGKKRIGTLRDQHITDALALGRMRSLAIPQREMPVRVFQHRASMQDDFPVPAESRNRENA